jgi:hypothetical protein
MKKSMFVKFVIGCAFFAFVSTMSFAQKSPQERTEKQVQKLKTDLNLSDEQVAKVQAATKKRVEQVEDIREDGKEKRKENRKENMDKAKAAMDAYNAEMKAIITPQKNTNIEKVREDRKEKMMEKREDRKDDRKGKRKSKDGRK